MTRLFDGKNTLEIYMGLWDDNTGKGPDITGDLLGPAFAGYDDDCDAIRIEGTVADFIDFANDWAAGKDEWTREALNDAVFDGPEAVEKMQREISARIVDFNEV